MMTFVGLSASDEGRGKEGMKEAKMKVGPSRIESDPIGSRQVYTRPCPRPR